jgi:tripartite-type tricarboxylate transporter receptor subunit TctC
MVKRLNFCRKVALAASAAVLGLVTLISTDAKAVDFSGKQITVIVPFSEGGGTDSYSRLMAPLFEKHLPGHPTILILNKPGGGGLSGANYYADHAKKDGTTVLALSTSSQSNWMLGDPRAQFEMKDFIPIILSPRGVTLYVRGDLGLQNEKTLKGKIEKLASYSPEKLNFGGKTPTSGDLALRVALSLLGVEVNSVWGLGGNGPMALGFERGEFQISYDNTLAFLKERKHLIEDGTAVPLFTFGVMNEDGKIERDPALPDVATVPEYYKAVYGKEPSGAAYEAWKSLMGVSVPLSKSWNLMAGTPKDVVEAWRNAAKEVYAEVMKTPAGKEVFGPYKNIMSDAAIRIRDEGTTLSPEAAKWLTKYVKVRYDVDISGVRTGS